MIASQAEKPRPREHLRQHAPGRGGNRGYWNSPLRFASGRLGAVTNVAAIRLLSDFINQLSHALDNQRLSLELRSRAGQLTQRTQELEASNQRLNNARTVERERFEAAIRHVVLLHLQDLPASLRWRSHHTQDPAAPAHLDRLISRTNEAMSALRTITRGVFAIQLAHRGLAAALQAYLAETSPTAVYAVDEAIHDQRFDARVEGTLYFCVVDLVSALTTVRRVEVTQPSESRIRVTLTAWP